MPLPFFLTGKGWSQRLASIRSLGTTKFVKENSRQWQPRANLFCAPLLQTGSHGLYRKMWLFKYVGDNLEFLNCTSKGNTFLS